MLQAAPEAFFMHTKTGSECFCLFHSPAPGTPVRGGVVHVHAFGEEMNKSRRTCALAAGALASAGFAVLQIDLTGCGDSSGEFSDATWETWISDVELGLSWLSARMTGVLWLWGVRAGALIASDVASRRTDTVNLIVWQPVFDGLAYLNQFLRLRIAADRLAGSASETSALLGALLAGEAQEIAGYSISPALASGLGEARLATPARGSRIICLEAATKAGASLSRPAEAWLSKAKEAGVAVDADTVAAPAFWQTQEIEEAHALVSATAEKLSES